MASVERPPWHRLRGPHGASFKAQCKRSRLVRVTHNNFIIRTPGDKTPMRVLLAEWMMKIGVWVEWSGVREVPKRLVLADGKARVQLDTVEAILNNGVHRPRHQPVHVPLRLRRRAFSRVACNSVVGVGEGVSMVLRVRVSCELCARV